MARKFLYAIAGIIVVILLVAAALSIWADEVTEIAMVPTAEFEPQPELEPNVYADQAMWIARPGLGADDPAMWRPEGLDEDTEQAALPAAVFFVHPTSYLERAQWNAPVDEPVSRERAELYVRGMASPFNRSVDVWAPRYRQAAIGAFLTDKGEAIEALDLAYGDVAQAFDFFLETVAPDKPIVLAGHSQGAYHLRRLLKEKVAGKPLKDRIAAAYVVGWPVSLEHGLPEMALPACTAPDQPGCIMGWVTFAEPADPSMVLRNYARKPGLDGEDLEGSAFLCTNPMTGGANRPAEASENLGSLVPDLANETGTLAKGVVPARCAENGLLLIGPPPKLDLGPYVLPGENYHLFDILLFWGNLRADVERRVEAWQKSR